MISSLARNAATAFSRHWWGGSPCASHAAPCARACGLRATLKKSCVSAPQVIRTCASCQGGTMELDNSMRQRLRAFDPALHFELSEDERLRILNEIATRAPALMRRARLQRTLLGVSTGTVLAAAAALLVAVAPREDDERATRQHAVPVQARACASDGKVTLARSPRPNGDEQVALGARAEFVTPTGAEVSVDLVEPCMTRISLHKGAIAVHAKDLGGGELRIRTQRGDVVVRGTMFRVENEDRALKVSVEHGRVSVLQGERELASVPGGQRIEVVGTGVRRDELSEGELQALRDTFVPVEALNLIEEQPAQAPQTTPRTVPSARRATPVPFDTARALKDAETLWRSGDLEGARSLFRKVGAQMSPTGEAAWLRLARLELTRGDVSATLSALNERARRHHRGMLGAEATWLEVEALDRVARKSEAQIRARALIHEFPDSPQANAARKLLKIKETP